jgi:hypothetical protein
VFIEMAMGMGIIDKSWAESSSSFHRSLTGRTGFVPQPSPPIVMVRAVARSESSQSRAILCRHHAPRGRGDSSMPHDRALGYRRRS